MKQELLIEGVNKEQEIYITVVRAFNLLDRTTALIEDSENDNEMEIAGILTKIPEYLNSLVDLK